MKEKSLGLRALLVGKPLHLFRFSAHSARISIPMVLAIPIMALKIAGASSSPGTPSTKVRSIFIMVLWGGFLILWMAQSDVFHERPDSLHSFRAGESPLLEGPERGGESFP